MSGDGYCSLASLTLAVKLCASMVNCKISAPDVYKRQGYTVIGYFYERTAKANLLAPMKYIKYILSNMPGSTFLEHIEYLDDYLAWNPLVKEFLL